jgi:hypothetical protein
VASSKGARDDEQEGRGGFGEGRGKKSGWRIEVRQGSYLTWKVLSNCISEEDKRCVWMSWTSVMTSVDKDRGVKEE